MEVIMLPPSNLSISPWEIEKSCCPEYWQNWFRNYWKVSLVLSATYILCIQWGFRWMKTRDRFELKTSLFLWNVALAVFSILGAWRSLPDIALLLRHPNWAYESICKRDAVSISFEFWAVLFTLSKAIELGDTLFIILRKRPLMFLHWYHHITVLCYTWYTYSASPSTSITFGAMNYAIHAFMYTYYALKVIHVPVPRKMSMTITLLQLIQMAAGIGINLYSAYAKFILKSKCDVTADLILLALLMYTSYFILFGDFFYKSYIPKTKNKSQ